MAFDKQLLAIIACPVCKGELTLVDSPKNDEQELVCKFDRLAFEIKENIPVLLEDQARTLTLDELDALR
jgi:uncharacterized protein YbaR (Trm112 family)